jgi:hypothetical protein
MAINDRVARAGRAVNDVLARRHHQRAEMNAKLFGERIERQQFVLLGPHRERIARSHQGIDRRLTESRIPHAKRVYGNAEETGELQLRKIHPSPQFTQFRQ